MMNLVYRVVDSPSLIRDIESYARILLEANRHGHTELAWHMVERLLDAFPEEAPIILKRLLRLAIIIDRAEWIAGEGNITLIEALLDMELDLRSMDALVLLGAVLRWDNSDALVELLRSNQFREALLANTSNTLLNTIYQHSIAAEASLRLLIRDPGVGQLIDPVQLYGLFYDRPFYVDIILEEYPNLPFDDLAEIEPDDTFISRLLYYEEEKF